jgi:hypothetical protein
MTPIELQSGAKPMAAETLIENIVELEEKHTTHQRSQHPKQHGCVWGEFIVADCIPDDLQVGVFQTVKRYPCWIRFSNAREKDDSQGGAHGMAIKLMGVPGSKILQGQEAETTQDFILFDSPVFFIRNLKDYLEFEQALDQAKGKPPLDFFFPNKFNPGTWRLKEFYILAVKLILLKRLFKLPSVFQTQYWSATPYKLGNNYTVRYFVKPVAQNNMPTRNRRTVNYLRESMVDFLRQRDAVFDFYVEVQTNQRTMPDNDPTVDWRSPVTYKLATLKIPAQIFDTPEQQTFGENLAYNPWHALPEHQPLGEMNETRKKVYQETSWKRHMWNGLVPREPQPQGRQPTWCTQNALTVLVPICTERQSELEAVLKKLSPEAFLGRSPATHLARFVVLHDPEQEIYQPHLLFTSNYDGPLEAYLQELSSAAATELDEIFRCCRDYTPGTAAEPLAWMRFIQVHSHHSQAFFVAAQGTTAQSILQNHQVCQRLDHLLDQPQAKAVFQDLQPLPTTPPPPEPAKPSPIQQLLEKLLKPIFNLLEFLLGIRKGPNDPSWRVPLNSAQQLRAEELQKAEDQFAQNQMTILLPIRCGIYKWILRGILELTKRRAQKSHGSLSGISTIHFARWAILEPGVVSRSEQSYLLFESNYNGSLDTYINDFVIYAGQRMNLIWGNCINYPRGGSGDIEWFKQHIRKYQFPAAIFYSAYPHLTISQVLINQAVCQSLSGFRQDPALKAFFTGSYGRAIAP